MAYECPENPKESLRLGGVVEWSQDKYKLSWGNTTVPGSPSKKMPTRLNSYEKILSLIGRVEHRYTMVGFSHTPPVPCTP
jgi:hypothetical protein